VRSHSLSHAHPSRRCRYRSRMPPPPHTPLAALDAAAYTPRASSYTRPIPATTLAKAARPGLASMPPPRPGHLPDRRPQRCPVAAPAQLGLPWPAPGRPRLPLPTTLGRSTGRPLTLLGSLHRLSNPAQLLGARTVSTLAGPHHCSWAAPPYQAPCLAR
jgi:hypothetical protein